VSVGALILGWGVGAGMTAALVSILTRELIRITQNADLGYALEIVDLVATLALCLWAAYRVTGILRQVRAGLETAVVAGLVTGLMAIAYNSLRHPDTLTSTLVVYLLALNIVLSSSGGVAGVWLGNRRASGRRDR